MAGRKKGKLGADGAPLKTPQETINEFGLEALCDWITEGRSYRDIAKDLGISLGSLTWWIDGAEERSQACARARELAAQTFDELAIETIESASDPFELAKAREIATHYRWRAKAVNPRRYGDKQQVDLKGDMNVTLFDPDQAARMAQLAYANRPK